MRNLESTYDVNDVKYVPDVYSKEDDLIDPTRRVDMGGKKLFVDKTTGIQKHNNFSSGYVPPYYNKSNKYSESFGASVGRRHYVAAKPNIEYNY